MFLGIDFIALGTFLVTTGTNNWILAFVLKNIILLWLIVKITPWAWDNKLFNLFKERWLPNDKDTVIKVPKGT
jgi:hypothetical protein